MLNILPKNRYYSKKVRIFASQLLSILLTLLNKKDYGIRNW